MADTGLVGGCSGCFLDPKTDLPIIDAGGSAALLQHFYLDANGVPTLTAPVQ